MISEGVFEVKEKNMKNRGDLDKINDKSSTTGQKNKHFSKSCWIN